MQENGMGKEEKQFEKDISMDSSEHRMFRSWDA